MAERVIIVPYDPQWPQIFTHLRNEIAAALGEIALRIEHVGSTVVPGLSAKPVIDIDVVIASDDVLAAAISKLAQIGYDYAGEKGIEGRHAFIQPTGLPAHHLYVCGADNPELARHIALRDHLIAHPEAAEAYGLLKQRLAEAFGEDREGYTNAKTEFIEGIIGSR